MSKIIIHLETHVSGHLMNVSLLLAPLLISVSFAAKCSTVFTSQTVTFFIWFVNESFSAEQLNADETEPKQ